MISTTLKSYASRSVRRVPRSSRRFESNKPLSSPRNIKTEAEAQEYLHQANLEMSKYHDAREMMRRGQLKSKNSQRSSSDATQAAQVGVVALFLVSFLATPFIGKKIAQDKEFREKYVPKWYDFTLKEEKGWTREELHEQMLQVQKDIRERAIRGEFTPDNLRKMQQNLGAVPLAAESNAQTAAWDKIHPEMIEDDENDLNEV